jgi:hypothetical protein
MKIAQLPVSVWVGLDLPILTLRGDDSAMTVMTVLPATGVVLSDARDAGRWLRVNWHAADNRFVVSIWRDEVCAASFQLTRRDSAELISSLVRGLSEPEVLRWSSARISTPKPGRRVRTLAAVRRATAALTFGRSTDNRR